MKEFRIDRLHSGGLITNYYCPSKCKHCLYRCSPKWPKDYIGKNEALKSFTLMKQFGAVSIHIGGGEPMLNRSGLKSVLEAAVETGVVIDYVETNSSWFTDFDSAIEFFEILYRLGLRTLLISISPFHNEYIPFYKVKGVIEACKYTGISILPWIADFIDEIEDFDDKKTHSLNEYQHRFGKDYIKKLPSRYWISPGGRALDTFSRYGNNYSPKELFNCGGCGELAETGHFHIDLYGNFIPGLCSGLAIKREDLGKSLDPNLYPIISMLYSGGVGELYQYASKLYGYQLRKDNYFSKCEMCFEIRKGLMVDHKIMSAEMQPREHYNLN